MHLCFMHATCLFRFAPPDFCVLLCFVNNANYNAFHRVISPAFSLLPLQETQGSEIHSCVFISSLFHAECLH
jgi:hypothetical protein